MLQYSKPFVCILLLYSYNVGLFVCFIFFVNWESQNVKNLGSGGIIVFFQRLKYLNSINII